MNIIIKYIIRIIKYNILHHQLAKTIRRTTSAFEN